MSSNRSTLMSEASELVDLYREISSKRLARDVEPAGHAIERALKNLDHGWTQETLDRAALELAEARQGPDENPANHRQPNDASPAFGVRWIDS